MDPSFRCSETPAELSASTQKRLNMYAIAASAAGVGMLALSPIADAKIIYTPAHTVIAGGTQLDLNHDGINDFRFSVFSYFTSHRSFGGIGVGRAYGAAGNQVRGIHTIRGRFDSYASALRAGALIGPKGAFTNQSQYATMATSSHSSIKHTSKFRGFWANGGKGVKNRYLGLKFFIRGKVHFGWARVNVTPTSQHLSGLLTGYAYETIPGKAIIAGATESLDDKSTVEQSNSASLATPKPQPPTLGLLAMGATGLSIWRRKEAMGAVQ